MNCKEDKGNRTSTVTELMNPINYIDPYISAVHISFAVIGILMNWLVAGTIIFTKQLRAFQNIAWLGVSFSNVFLLSSYLIEVGAAREGISYIFLPLHRGILGLPPVCIILNLHLSLLERRIFFNYPTFHKNYVTSASIIAIQLICFVLISLLLKGSIFFQSLTLSFNRIFNEVDIGITFTSLFIGFITLYIPCKKCIEDNMNHSNSLLTNNTSHSEESEQAHHNENDQVMTSSSGMSNFPQNQDGPSGIHGCKNDGRTLLDSNNQSFSLLELQGYYSIKINIKIFFISGSILLLLFSFSNCCLLIATINKSSIDSCSNWFGTAYLIRVVLLGFYTALFNSLCLVGHSRDFFVLRLSCSVIGGIARATRHLINQLNKPITPDVVVNV